MVQKLFSITFTGLFLSINSVYSVYIKYKDLSSDNEEAYTELVKQIKNEPHLNIYHRLRSFLGSRTLPSGPLIAPNWFVRGVHTDPKNKSEVINNITFYKVGIREEQPRFNKKDSYVIKSDYFVQCYNTDIGLYHCYRLDNQPILDQHIIEQATISDINNKENRFFALTRSLHKKNGNCWKNLSHLEDDTYVIPCKPTNMDPSAHQSLKFEIDNTKFPELYFETYPGDSCSPMLLMTKENEIKVVGPHFPGTTCFNVVNIAFPANKKFIDQFLASTSTQNLPRSFSSGNHSENLWFKYKKIPKRLSTDMKVSL